MATYPPPSNNSDVFDTTTFTKPTISTLIPDGSLTIAKTNTLQTVLNNKLPFLFPVVNLGAKTANFTIASTDLGKMCCWTTTAVITVTLPSALGLPDGTWIGLSAVSANATARNQSVTPSGQTTLGTIIADVNTAAGGNGRIVIVMSDLWKYMAGLS